MRLRGALLLAAMTAVLGMTPASAGAATLQLRETGVTGSRFVTDGERYIAVATSAAEVTVIDVRGGARVVLPTPQDCALADVHRGAVLWTCESPPNVCCGRFETGLVYDIATRARRVLPRAPTRPNDTVAEGGGWAELGARFARSTYAGYHLSGSLYTDLRTGRVRQVHDRRDTVVQLDGPQLTRRLCSGQLRPQVSDDTGSLLIPGPLATAGRWAASLSFSERDRFASVKLQRCGQPTRILRRCPKIACSEPVIDSRYVAWAERSRTGSGSMLSVRSLRSGLARRTTATGSGLTPMFVGGRLYVVGSRPLDGRPLAPIVQRLLRVAL